MTIIEQIKAEIERRLKKYATDVTMPNEALGKVILELKGILSFLSTLELEKPMQDGLEEEIQRFLSNATKMDKGEWKGKYPISEMGFGVVARHFAQWGEHNALENLRAARRTEEAYQKVAEVMREQIKDGEELEKEVHNYLKIHHLHIKDGGRVVFDNGDSPNFMCDVRDIAGHFAQWGAEHLKK